MSAKLNSFILSDNIIEKMKDKIEETRSKKIETGFSLCTERIKDVRNKDDNILKIGNDCQGTECRISRPIQRCREKDKYRGLFHTHPSGEIRPSLSDILSMYEDGIGCIGITKDDTKIIRCSARKDKISNEESRREIRKSYILFEMLPSGITVKDYESEVERLTNKYFREIDIK